MSSSHPPSSSISAVSALLLFSALLLVSSGSEAEERFRCPRGQILRVSTQTCVPKAANPWLLASTKKEQPTPPVRAGQRSERTASIPHSAPKLSDRAKMVASRSKQPAKSKTPQLKEQARLAEPREDETWDELTESSVAPSERERDRRDEESKNELTGSAVAASKRKGSTLSVTTRKRSKANCLDPA